MNEPTAHRVLVCTDLPFWRGASGAQQRILSLVEFLRKRHAVRIFCLAGSTEVSELDAETIAAKNLDVEFRSSDQIPASFWKRVGWYFAATKNQWFPKSGSTTQRSASTTLADYRWPWAIDALHESIESFRPNVLLIEYVKLAYLIEGLSKQIREQLFCVLDTHDVLHLRNEQFRSREVAHWINIDREAESAAVGLFDLAIAIQSEEAELFRDMAPQTNVITCGHFTPTPIAKASDTPSRTADESLTTVSENSNPVLRFGFIGSDNHANMLSLQTFLETTWRFAVEQLAPKSIELRIAGRVCDQLNLECLGSTVGDTIEIVGYVDSLDQFYDSVDVIVNPVQFGTGLKIKNIEALAYAKPLISTPHSLTGMQLDSAGEYADVGLPARIFETPESFVELVALLLDPITLKTMAAAAKRYRQTVLSEQSVYSELDQVLSNLK
ncbi:MAG: glycosyltransferase [Planctomycetota bacterium]